MVQATEAVEGDVSANLGLLLPHLNKVPSRPEWLGQIKDWKTRLPFAFDRGTPDGLIKPQNVIEKLSELTAHMKDRTIITTGVSTSHVLPGSANIPRLANTRCGRHSISDGDIHEP